MIIAEKNSLCIDGEHYSNNDKKVFDFAWEMDTNQEDFPLINRYYSIRMNDKGHVYLYDEIESSYEGFSGTRLRITLAKDFKTLYNYVMGKYEESSDSITGKYIYVKGGYATDTDPEDIEELKDLPNIPGSSEEFTKYVLFESSLLAFTRGGLSLIVSYIGGVYIGDVHISPTD